MDMDQQHVILKQEQKHINADLEHRWQRVWRAYDKSRKRKPEGTTLCPPTL
jgi:hypothetical protein